MNGSGRLKERGRSRMRRWTKGQSGGQDSCWFSVLCASAITGFIVMVL